MLDSTPCLHREVLVGGGRGLREGSTGFFWSLTSTAMSRGDCTAGGGFGFLAHTGAGFFSAFAGNNQCPCLNVCNKKYMRKI
ncbi:hypothetical protein DPMN_068907 [Dreissena polymorpha]|uniref:Uncharacterized protein n=1 Tax=Dreissena polymorpha TaxID=45954 RepID=A0A9D4BUJ1_DREPO|nr:hypothetical protein DPMN_068907 [Dreissena polymorpha]